VKTVKRNTILHPTYHGRGLGQLMTRHANAVADEEGQPTFVLARPMAYRMLENTGFVLGETVRFETARFAEAVVKGGMEEVRGRNWDEVIVRAYRREPPLDLCS
jgi:hypothetical protein